MRIMLDTNVLISAVLFPGRRFYRLLEIITTEHTMVLSTFVIEELLAVTDRKFPQKRTVIDRFLSELSYELIYTPRCIQEEIVQIRDPNDYPILYSAVLGDVDLLITGDKDFSDLELERPEILTPSQFLALYDA